MICWALSPIWLVQDLSLFCVILQSLYLSCFQLCVSDFSSFPLPCLPAGTWEFSACWVALAEAFLAITTTRTYLSRLHALAPPTRKEQKKLLFSSHRQRSINYFNLCYLQILTQSRILPQTRMLCFVSKDTAHHFYTTVYTRNLFTRERARKHARARTHTHTHIHAPTHERTNANLYSNLFTAMCS